MTTLLMMGVSSWQLLKTKGLWERFPKPGVSILAGYLLFLSLVSEELILLPDRQPPPYLPKTPKKAWKKLAKKELRPIPAI